jgi:hypothetical protein
VVPSSAGWRFDGEFSLPLGGPNLGKPEDPTLGQLSVESGELSEFN